MGSLGLCRGFHGAGATLLAALSVLFVLASEAYPHTLCGLQSSAARASISITRPLARQLVAVVSPGIAYMSGSQPEGMDEASGEQALSIAWGASWRPLKPEQPCCRVHRACASWWRCARGWRPADLGQQSHGCIQGSACLRSLARRRPPFTMTRRERCCAPWTAHSHGMAAASRWSVPRRRGRCGGLIWPRTHDRRPWHASPLALCKPCYWLRKLRKPCYWLRKPAWRRSLASGPTPLSDPFHVLGAPAGAAQRLGKCGWQPARLLRDVPQPAHPDHRPARVLDVCLLRRAGAAGGGVGRG